jgi:hypothetical protein
MAPPSTPRSLSRVEFEQLLQRAVERHAKDGPRTFNVGELVEAGHELGIDAETVRAVYQEHQRELGRPPTRQRPFDSKLTLAREGDTFTLSIPPRTAVKVWGVLQPALFAGMLAFLLSAGSPRPITAGVAVVGAVMALILIQSARTTRQVVLNRDGSGMLVRQRGGRHKGIPLQAGQVHARLGVREVQTQQGIRQVRFLALDHGTQTHELLEGYSLAEQAWAADEIERWLGR